MSKSRGTRKAAFWRMIEAHAPANGINRQYLHTKCRKSERKFIASLTGRGLQPETLCYGDLELIRPQSVQTVSTRMRSDALWVLAPVFRQPSLIGSLKWGISVGIVLRLK
jgi:hypothetical protein